MTRRNTLYNLFVGNTGKNKIRMPPYRPPENNSITGYQLPRMQEFWGRRRRD